MPSLQGFFCFYVGIFVFRSLSLKRKNESFRNEKNKQSYNSKPPNWKCRHCVLK